MKFRALLGPSSVRSGQTYRIKLKHSQMHEYENICIGVVVTSSQTYVKYIRKKYVKNVRYNAKITWKLPLDKFINVILDAKLLITKHV